MTPNALTVALNFLSEEYNARIGRAVSKGLPANGQWDAVTWLWQNMSLKSVAQESDATGAVLLDAEIGLCLFLQLFDQSTDIRAQLARALSIKSQLLPSTHAQGFEYDGLGEWSTSVLWLCEPKFQADWIQQVASLRSETAHFEEISVDLLVQDSNGWPSSFSSYSFPRLLLRTREALRRTERAASYDWLNADPIIRQRLQSSLQGANEDWGPTRALVLNHLAALKDHQPAADSSHSAKALLRLEATSFRNIDTLDLHFRDPTEPVSASIIQGPNGTGKSAISEAVSIGLGKVSSRYLEFLEDTNEPPASKAEKYADIYLSPLNKPEAKPQIRLNGEGKSCLALSDPQTAKAQCAHLSGTLLSQSWAQHLSRIKADELGSVIAGNYSHLASSIMEFIESNLANSEGERTNFNQEWGLRANVTRGKTAMLKIASSVLDSLLPMSRDLLNWSERGSYFEWRFQEPFRALDSRLKSWVSDGPSRAQLIANAGTTNIAEVLQRLFIEQNSLLEDAARLNGNVLETVAAASTSAPELITHVKLWGDWLRRPNIGASQPDSVALIQAKQRVGELQKALELATGAGTALRDRREQIQSTLSFVEKHWSMDHPDQCPVCDSNLQARGGVAAVLSKLSEELSHEIETARVQFSKIREQLTDATGHLSTVAREIEPLAAEQQTSLRIALTTLVTPDYDTQRLRDPDHAGHISALWMFASERKALPGPLTSETIRRTVTEGAERITAALARFLKISEAPEQWKSIRAAVSADLAKSIEDHLPKTIQALWLEVARAMMPAPWQYPGSVKFAVSARKSSTEARLILQGENKSGLAAHILNSAELHNLGLAWYFARYLTHGRYYFSAMVLDDPAGQMDEPSFRDFCRYLEAMLRLHKSYSIPLTMVLFLHQDDRALAAARTTDATIHFLRWHKGTASITKSMKTRTFPVTPALPYKVSGISFG